MPLKGTAKKVMKKMKSRYGNDKGKKIFYATANKQGRDHKTWQKEDFEYKLDGALGLLNESS